MFDFYSTIDNKNLNQDTIPNKINFYKLQLIWNNNFRGDQLKKSMKKLNQDIFWPLPWKNARQKPTKWRYL